MAKVTVAMLQAQVEALKSENAGLTEALRLANHKLRHESVDIAEYRRVQGVLKSTQQFCSKYKREARGGNGRLRLADQRGPDGETAAQRAIREHREAQA